MAAEDIKSAAQFKEVYDKGIVLVQFHATWCGPCKMITPVVEKLVPQYPGVKYYKLDIEEVPEISAEYQVSTVPTLIFFKDGKPVQVVKGAAPAKIKQALDSLKDEAKEES